MLGGKGIGLQARLNAGQRAGVDWYEKLREKGHLNQRYFRSCTHHIYINIHDFTAAVLMTPEAHALQPIGVSG